ncbi:MAG: acyl-CoA dehydratase activase [Candidatus Margulisiibacteriota bacterium]
MRTGIDLGSRSVKVVKLDGTTIVDKQIFDSFQFYTQFFSAARGLAQSAMLEGEVTVTGYGKFSEMITGVKKISEIEAHARGACFQTGLNDFTLLDIGGQDTKVVKVQGGAVHNFTMNDKCAAGSGRFLENMCRILDTNLTELAKYSGEGPILNSTCAIYAESELISKIIEGYPFPELCAGVNRTLLLRVLPMVKRHLTDVIVFVGGVAQSAALKSMLERELDIKVIVPPEAQFNGAVGCGVGY